jgi:hypothetical protein
MLLPLPTGIAWEKKVPMKTELLQKVLEHEPGVRLDLDRGGEGHAGSGQLGARGSYVIGDEVDLTVHLEIGHEAVSVARVRRVTLTAELLVFETHKNERVYVAADPGIRALKFTPSDAGKKASTGFAALR